MVADQSALSVIVCSMKINYPVLKKFGFFLLTFTGAILPKGYSQTDNKPNITNSTFLKTNSVVLFSQAGLEKAAAVSMAAVKGWELSGTDMNGEVRKLQRMDDEGFPIYYITTNNSIAAGTTRTNKLYSGGGLGLSLSGSTITAGKIAIWDSDAPLASHIEFAGGRIEVRDKTTTTSPHSTHVAGTMIAAGINPLARGMAFGLPKLYAFNFDNDTPEMSANAASLLISSHSYGTAAGWSLNTSVSPERWEFYGAPGANEDYKFGYYDTQASEWDKICYNAPYYLPVKSAGNNRTVNGPDPGQPYYRYNAERVMTAAGNRPAGISSNNQYDNISTYGNAKNILTIGAVNPLGNGPYQPGNIKIASFSSWGPTDDGRIKPDLVADGVNVTSTSNTANNSYAVLSGTSMATPNVSGSLILLQELYNQQKGGSFMLSATLKALVIATAAEAGNTPGPDYTYGWGLMNTEAAAKVILGDGRQSKITESSLTQGEKQYIEVTASGEGPLTGTICWTDPEAIAISSTAALNNPAPRLINDLDLRATSGTAVYNPWVLDPARPAAAAYNGDNTRDNVEQVVINDPVPGAVYKFSISHKGTLKRGSQFYSAIITGITGTGTFTTTKMADDDPGLKLSIYPVPAKDEINVTFNVPEPVKVSVSVINLSGQELYREEKENFKGAFYSRINLAAYTSGLYFILVKAGNHTYTRKFTCIK